MLLNAIKNTRPKKKIRTADIKKAPTENRWELCVAGQLLILGLLEAVTCRQHPSCVVFLGEIHDVVGTTPGDDALLGEVNAVQAQR